MEMLHHSQTKLEFFLHLFFVQVFRAAMQGVVGREFRSDSTAAAEPLLPSKTPRPLSSS